MTNSMTKREIFFGIILLGVVVYAGVTLASGHFSGNSQAAYQIPDTLNAVVTIFNNGSIEETVEKEYPGYSIISGGVISSFALGEKSTATTLRLVIGRKKVK